MRILLDRILLSENAVNEFNVNYNNLQFKNWLLNLLPEVEKCKNLKQDNPWHVYNCLEHILHAIEEINKQTLSMNSDVRRLLAYTMFLHDIGKPDCAMRRFSKLYNREVDSFINHNKAGVRIAKRVLKSFGFDKKEEDVILKLIDKHDIFMFITLTDDGNKYHKVLSEVLVKEEIEDLNKVGNGTELLEYLIMIGRSDNLAQNPEMTKDSLFLLDTMQNMLNNVKLNVL